MYYGQQPSKPQGSWYQPSLDALGSISPITIILVTFIHRTVLLGSSSFLPAIIKTVSNENYFIIALITSTIDTETIRLSAAFVIISHAGRSTDDWSSSSSSPTTNAACALLRLESGGANGDGTVTLNGTTSSGVEELEDDVPQVHAQERAGDAEGSEGPLGALTEEGMMKVDDEGGRGGDLQT